MTNLLHALDDEETGTSLGDEPYVGFHQQQRHLAVETDVQHQFPCLSTETTTHREYKLQDQCNTHTQKAQITSQPNVRFTVTVKC